MTQKELANAVGVCQTAVTQWETGRTVPRFERLREIAKALGCSVDDLTEPD